MSQKLIIVKHLDINGDYNNIIRVVEVRMYNPHEYVVVSRKELILSEPEKYESSAAQSLANLSAFDYNEQQRAEMQEYAQKLADKHGLRVFDESDPDGNFLD